MSESTTHPALPLTPIVYTVGAVMLSIACRALLMPAWSPIEAPSKSLSFLILWVMSVLPILYLAFRYWAEKSIDSFVPQVLVFLALSFGIQTSLNAVSMGLQFLDISAPAAMPLVWALPWLALVTVLKNGYKTTHQCTRLLMVFVPLLLLAQVGYWMVPLLALAYGGVDMCAVSYFALVAFLYGVFAWRLSKKDNS